MATKEEYLEKLKAQLANWDTEVAELEAKASEATTELKAEIEEQIGNLRVKFREGELKFDEISSATEEKWEELKEDAEQIFDKLIDDFKEDIEYATTEAQGLIDKVKSLFK
ncbi:hypothetical protein MCAMS1_01919 [biofilm metagenome]